MSVWWSLGLIAFTLVVLGVLAAMAEVLTRRVERLELRARELELLAQDLDRRTRILASAAGDHHARLDTVERRQA